MSHTKMQTLKKVKPYHLLAVTVLSATLVNSKIKAEEVEYYDSATNLSILQNQSNPKLTSDFTTPSRAIFVEDSEKKLDQMVSNAQSNGLIVEETPVEDLGIYSNEQDYQNALNDRNSDYQSQIENLSNEIENYKELNRQYEQEKVQVEMANQNLLNDYQDEVTRISSTNAIRKKEFEEQSRIVEDKNLQIEKENQLIAQENQKNYDAYILSLEKAKKAVENSKVNQSISDVVALTKEKYTPSLYWQNFASQTLNSNITVVAEGNVQSKEHLTDGTYTVTAFSTNENPLLKSSIVSSVRWENQIPIGETLVNGDKISEELMMKAAGQKVYDTSSGNTSQEWSVKTGQWVTFPQIVTLADGTKRDLRAKFEKTGSKMDFGQDWILLWNANGAINYLDGTSLMGHYPDDGVKVTYEIVAEKELQKSYLWILAALDIDGGQTLTLHEPNDTALLSLGGGLKVHSNTSVQSDEDLGYTYGNGHNQNALDGVNSTPDGVVIYASYGKSIVHELRNSLGGRGTLVADADFGISVQTNVVAKYEEKPLRQLEELPKVNYLDLPEEPSLKKLPEKPQIPILKIQRKKIGFIPSLQKIVLNSDGQQINQQHIAKGSEVTWKLSLPKLPQNLEQVEEVTIFDKLPQGFILDKEKTRTINPDFEIAYNEQTFDLSARAKLRLVESLNAGHLIPNLQIIGTVSNDAAIYRNRYMTEYKLKDGSNHSLSNIVTIATAGRENNKFYNEDNLIQPLKYTYNNLNQLADNRTFITGDTLSYRLVWDLDQYKGDQSGQDAIIKGFAFVDDIPEDVLDVLEQDIKMFDSTGQEVKELKLTYYSSVSNLNDEDQRLLNNANINPNGSFLLWKPTNCQDFYQNYVQTGKSIIITLPMKLENVSDRREFENQAYQIDFGNGYRSNSVVNSVQPLESHKGVLTKELNELSDGSMINLNETFYYTLGGAIVQSNQAIPLSQYQFYDDYDENHDEYLNHYYILLDTDVSLKDGTQLPRGTDITNFSNLLHQDGYIFIDLHKDFLESLLLESEFKASAFIEMKRIKSGTVKNRFTNIVNGKEVVSNEVITQTPEPPAETKKESQSKTNINQVSNEKVLPKTSDSEKMNWSALSIVISLLLPLLMIKNWRKDGRSI